ncbi:hypothetical protein HB770_28115 (plasmid) [Rhizobium leguminosarum bv. viciae]|uniref:Uncharacterized protein n=1 Tax=Rhizobium leguminosarum bv. viciae TaxID=387 RepID=A0A7G6RMU2_RHILV|nr:hypothetical protein HB770_28115 [Rhizobium leguminosarum bv. viciae]
MLNSIEVFADNGRWTGSKRIPGFAAARSATLTGAVAEAWRLAIETVREDRQWHR